MGANRSPLTAHRPMFALTASVVLLCFGAAIGVMMAVLHARGVKSGTLVGILHGVFTVSGVAALVVGLVDVEAGAGWWILVSFLVVASGGAYLLSRQMKDEPWPGAIIAAHGGLALVTLTALGLWTFTSLGGDIRDVEVSDVPQDVEAVGELPADVLPNKDPLDDGPPADWPAEGTEDVFAEPDAAQ